MDLLRNPATCLLLGLLLTGVVTISLTQDVESGHMSPPASSTSSQLTPTPNLLLRAMCPLVKEDIKASFFKRCARDSPEVNECLDNAIQYTIRSLSDGYQSLSKLDPLNLAKVSLKSPDGKTLDLLNYDVTGLSSVSCQNTSFTNTDVNTFRLSFDLFVRSFDARGSYKMDRYFLGSPKPNSGNFTFSLTGYRANFVLAGEIETNQRDGKRYAKISGVSSNFYGGTNPRVNFSNLGTGHNKLWNSQPEQLLQAYKEAIDLVHPVLAAAYSNLIFQTIPIDELFPTQFGG